jgi:hypothetical protein
MSSLQRSRKRILFSQRQDRQSKSLDILWPDKLEGHRPTLAFQARPVKGQVFKSTLAFVGRADGAVVDMLPHRIQGPAWGDSRPTPLRTEHNIVFMTTKGARRIMMLSLALVRTSGVQRSHLPSGEGTRRANRTMRRPKRQAN